MKEQLRTSLGGRLVNQRTIDCSITPTLMCPRTGAGISQTLKTMTSRTSCMLSVRRVSVFIASVIIYFILL